MTIKLNENLTNTYKTELYSAYQELSQAEEKILVIEAKKGNKVAQNKLVNANLPSLIRIATAYSKLNTNNELSDLLAIATLEFIERIYKFDETLNNRLYTYSILHVKNAVKYYSVDNHVVKNGRQHSSSRPCPNYNKNVEYEADIRGISVKEMKASRKISNRIDGVTFNANSMDALIGGNDDNEAYTLHDTIESDCEPTDTKALAVNIDKLLSVLDKDELRVIKSLFGIDSAEMNGEEIARDLNMTRQTVNLRKHKALAKLSKSYAISLY